MYVFIYSFVTQREFWCNDTIFDSFELGKFFLKFDFICFDSFCFILFLFYSIDFIPFVSFHFVSICSSILFNSFVSIYSDSFLFHFDFVLIHFISTSFVSIFLVLICFFLYRLDSLGLDLV